MILPDLGHLRPADVTAARIGQLVRDLEQTLKPRSVARYLAPMNELLKRAMQHGAVSMNTWATLTSDQRPMPAEARQRHEWSMADLASLLAAAGTLDGRPEARQGYLPVIATLIFTGARVSEVLALRWQHVDLGSGTIEIHHSRARDGQLTSPKTRAGRRTVPIPGALLRILAQHKPAVATDEAWVFPALGGQQPISYWNFRNRGFAKALELAGLSGKGITIHDLRHAAASLLIEAGVTDVAVAAQLGHANANVTRAIYAHKFGDAARDRVLHAFSSIGATN